MKKIILLYFFYSILFPAKPNPYLKMFLYAMKYIYLFVVLMEKHILMIAMQSVRVLLNTHWGNVPTKSSANPLHSVQEEKQNTE